MEQYFPLRNDGRRSTHHAAAALSSLGCTIKTERIHDYRTKTEGRSFFIGSVRTASVFSQAETPPWISTASGARHILHLWQTGDLAQLDPLHPFLDCLRALENYEMIKAALAGRIRAIRLAPDPAPQRTLLIEGDELPARLATPRARTSCPHKAAACTTLGIPIISITGGRITLGAGLFAEHDPADLMRSLDAETIAFAHPFVTAWNACRYLDVLDTHLNTEAGTLNISQAGHSHRALVTADATGAAMDRAIQFSLTGR